MTRWTLLLVVLGMAMARPAEAATRLAVIIVADDAHLSNNLTEVAIARLADKTGYELLGLRELESRLNELSTVKSDGIRACLALSSCLSEVGGLAGTEKVVIGDVRREGDHYRLELALVVSQTGTPESRFSRDFPLDLDQLIAAVQQGVFELVPHAEVNPPPLALATSPLPPKPTESRAVVEADRRAQKPAGESFVPYLAYGTAALAVVAFSAAAVTGTIGAARPVGNSRAEVQDDLERRRGYAAAANGLFVTGAVLTATSAVCFVVSWD